MKLLNHAMKEKSLSKMHKELIAVGISAYANCEPCMTVHVREALRGGATDDQTVEAVDVAIEMGGGPPEKRKPLHRDCEAAFLQERFVIGSGLVRCSLLWRRDNGTHIRPIIMSPGETSGRSCFSKSRRRLLVDAADHEAVAVDLLNEGRFMLDFPGHRIGPFVIHPA